jgi:hypothetical protein
MYELTYEKYSNFLTLDNATKYNNVTDKFVFIMDELELSINSILLYAIEGKLIDLLIQNNIDIK